MVVSHKKPPTQQGVKGGGSPLAKKVLLVTNLNRKEKKLINTDEP